MPKKQLFIALLGAICVIALGFLLVRFNAPQEVGLHIHFFNAGKADSALITFDERVESASGTTEFVPRTVLIDTGESNLAPTLLNYLNAKNITKLDYLIITHFDKDHVGSAAEIIKNLEIGTVLQTNTEKDSDEYRAYLSALEEKEITPVVVADDSSEYSFSLANTINFEILGPEKLYSTKPSNNSSLITRVSVGNHNFLFMGDAETDRLADFLETSIANTHYDLLKVPYHGHFQENLAGLISATTPSNAVITSSYEEPEDEETLDLLKQVDSNIFVTRRGDIEVYSDGKDLRIRQ